MNLHLNKSSIFASLLSIMLVFALGGCGGGGGGGSKSSDGSTNTDTETGTGTGTDTVDNPVFIEWEKDAATLSGQVLLPENSPLPLSQIEVDLYDYAAKPSSDGSLNLKVPKDQVVDTYIMLPKRAGDSLPTIYLYTTLLPGELEVVLSPEETAVSMIMGRISQDYLTTAGTAEEVKQLVRDNGQTFIDAFTAQLEIDPYTLRVENQLNVYNQTYEDAVEDVRVALIAASVSGKAGSRGAPAAASGPINGSQLYVYPDQIQYDFAVYEDTTGLLGQDTWADLEDLGGTMTGKLKVENDTMLFAHYKVIDLINSQTLTKLDVDSGVTGMLRVAFHPDILAPQKGWTRLWWSSTGKIDTDYKSSRVILYTPQLSGDESTTNEDRQIGTALAFRTGASTLMTIVSTFLPVDKNGSKHWFIEMNEQGLLSAAYDKFAHGELKGGLETLFWTFCDGKVMEKVIQGYLKNYLKNALNSDETTAKFLNKFNQVFKKIPITKIGLAVDVLKLVDDYSSIPGQFSFHRVEFPFNLTNTGPSPLNKVAFNEPLPIITVTGMGLGAVYYGSHNFMPQVFLEAEDALGRDITLYVDKDDVTISASGDSLWFELPRHWAGIGSDVVGPIYVNVRHQFLDEHGIDELITLTLPHEDHEEYFKLDFESSVVITSLSSTKPSRGEEITIYGTGFASTSSNNTVVFTDHNGLEAIAEIVYSMNTLLEVVVPEALAIGPLSVVVELDDNSVSNVSPLSLRPKAVMVDTPDGTHFIDSLSIYLSQEEDIDIFYSVGTGGIIPYNGALTIEESSRIYPIAKVVVDGIEYVSSFGGYSYYKCAINEELIDGECIAPNSIQPPTASPIASEFTDSVSVTLSSPDGVYVAYRVDDGDLYLYNVPIVLTESATIYAYSDTDPSDPDASFSEVALFTYTKVEESGGGGSGSWVQDKVDIEKRCDSSFETSYDITEKDWYLQQEYSDGTYAQKGSGTFSTPPTVLTPGATLPFAVSVTTTAAAGSIPLWYLGSYISIGSGSWALSIRGVDGEPGTFSAEDSFVVPDSGSCGQACNTMTIETGMNSFGCFMSYTYTYSYSE